MSLIEHARGFMNGIRGDAGVGVDRIETGSADAAPQHDGLDDRVDRASAELLAEWDAQPHH